MLNFKLEIWVELYSPHYAQELQFVLGKFIGNNIHPIIILENNTHSNTIIDDIHNILIIQTCTIYYPYWH